MTEELRGFAQKERRKGYKELGEELEAHADRIEARLHRFFFRCLAAFAVLGLTSAISLLGFGVVLKQQARNSRDIQQQRYDTLMTNCLEQNRRHDRAQARAEEVLPLESQENVALLIAELQPHVGNCKDYADNRVKGLGG